MKGEDGIMDISVVVCTYNRDEMLRSALESLTCQETNENFSYEVLVVDNGSTDGTYDVVNDFIKKTTKFPIRYVYEEDKGIADARNRGIREVCGEWIAFFDDDQWAEPYWLLELFKVAVKKEADCVGGPVLLDLPESVNLNLRPFCRGALRELIPSDEPERWSEKIGLGTGNVVIRRKLFERIGTFDPNIMTGGSDSDFFWRANKQGAKMWYAPKGVVHHKIPESRLCEEYFRRTSLRGGLSSARLRYRYKGRVRWVLGLGRRLFRSCTRDVWLLLIALLLRNKSRQLDRQCRLWRTIGYVRGSVFLLAPGIFSQKRFFDTLNYETRGGESATENREGDRKR